MPCPVDDHPVDETDLRPPPPYLVSFVGRLEIKCDFESLGCTQIPKLCDLSSHLKECPHNPGLKRECDLKCGATLLRTTVDLDFPPHSCQTYLISKMKEEKDQALQIKGLLSILETQQRNQEKLESDMKRLEQKMELVPEVMEALNQSLANYGSDVEVMKHSVDQKTAELQGIKHELNTLATRMYIMENLRHQK
jgi:hypothetical protein